MYIPRGGFNMEATTQLIANETEIKQAMSALGIDIWVDDLLDEIELNRRLKKSLEQFDKGETTTVEEMMARTAERLKNGYYLRK
jgi:ribosome-interacting GTPase 1